MIYVSIISGLSLILVGFIVYLNYRFKEKHFDLLADENKKLMEFINTMVNKGMSSDWFTYVNGQKLLGTNQITLDYIDDQIKKKADDSKDEPAQLHPEGATPSQFKRKNMK